MMIQRRAKSFRGKWRKGQKIAVLCKLTLMFKLNFDTTPEFSKTTRISDV